MAVGEKIKNILNKKSISKVSKQMNDASASASVEMPTPSIATPAAKDAALVDDLAKRAQNSLPRSGQELVNQVAASGTFDEQNQAIEQAKEISRREIADKENIVGNTAQTLDQMSAIDQQQMKAVPQVQDFSPTDVKTLPGGGGTLEQVIGSPFGTRPSYDSIATKNDVAKDIVNSASRELDSAPGLVLEKLQPHDYYPNLSKDIAVGTYSGKYLGSVTLFAAPGARMPLGLYDARKRALAEQAKAKQEEIDRILSVPETDPLYQAQYSDYFLNGALGYMDKHGWNTTALKRDPEAIKFFSRMQAKAREISAATAFANDVMTKSQDTKNYVPKKMRDNAYEVKMNLLNKTEDILSGDESAIKPIQDAKVYSSLVPAVDDLAKRIFDPNNLSQAPINLNTGGQYDNEKFIKEKDDFLQQVRDFNPDTETYVTGVLKYFGGSIDKLVDELMVATPNANEDQKQALKEYLAAQVPKQVILKYTTTKNGSEWRAQLAERRRQFNLKLNNFWGGVNDANNDAVNNTTGKTYNQELAELQRKGLTGKALQSEMKRLSEIYHVGDQSYLNGSINSFVNFVQASPDLREASAELQPVRQGKNIRKINVEVYNPKKNKWDNVYVPVDEMYKYAKSQVRDPQSKRKFTTEEQEAYKQAQSGNVWIKPSGYEIRKAFVDRYGNVQYLKSDGTNLDEYNASRAKKTYAVPVEKMFNRVSHYDELEHKTVYSDVPMNGTIYGAAAEISSPEGQAILNNKYGYGIEKAAASSQMGETSWESGSSSGSSSSSPVVAGGE